MENKLLKTKKWLLAMMLCCAAACLLLGACGSCDSCISGCSVLRSIWTPEMSLIGDEKTPMPVITGSIGADELTVLLAEHYAPVAETVELANETADLFSLAHELVLAGDSYYLHSAIMCSTGGQLNLPRIYIPYAGETVIPEWSVPEELDGSARTAAWLELTANGVEFDLSRLDDDFSMADVAEIFVSYYRSVSKRDIDISRFAETIDYDQLCREAMVLGIIDGEYAYEFDTVDPMTLITASADLLSAMYNDACGNGSTGFTDEELLGTIDTFLRFATPEDEQWAADCELLLGLLKNMLDDSRLQSDAPEHTRMSAAATLVKLYEMMYGPIELTEYSDTWVCDTDDDNCVKAVMNSFMENFPSGSQFAPDYVPGRYQMPELVDGFISSCRIDNVDAIGDYSADGGDVMRSLAAVDICVRTAGISRYEPQVVVNSRDYDWYYTQHGTGWYSSLNCMPTITMMATKWYDQSTTVTIEEMRERYLPENTGGWYTWQVAESLTENGVPNELVDVSENMLPYLDDGKIILTQMTEAADGESGHCFVIYGYWKLGDTIKYLVHDSDVYDGIDEFGQRPGKAMILDGRYCDWIINRIAFSFIVVG